MVFSPFLDNSPHLIWRLIKGWHGLVCSATNLLKFILNYMYLRLYHKSGNFVVKILIIFVIDGSYEN